MKVRTCAVGPQLHKLDAFETEADYRPLLCVFVPFIPDTTLGSQHLGIFSGEAIKARASQSIFAVDEEAQRDGQLAKCFLIGFDSRQPGHQIAFAVGSAASIELAIDDGRRKWSNRPFTQMAHRLHIVVTVEHVALRPGTTFAVDDRIASADAKRPGPYAYALHHLFDSFCDSAHARAARGHGWHTAESLQTLREVARMAVNVSIKTSEGHRFLQQL